MDRNEGRRSDQDVEQWMRSKGVLKCPLCRLEAWNFTELRLVIVISASGASQIGGGLRALRGQGLRGIVSALSSELRNLRRELRVLRNASKRPPMLEIKCSNCGHVELLDEKALGSEPKDASPNLLG